MNGPLGRLFKGLPDNRFNSTAGTKFRKGEHNLPVAPILTCRYTLATTNPSGGASPHSSLPEHRRYTGRQRNGGHGEPSLCGLRNDDNGHHNSAIGGRGKDGRLVGKIRVFFRQFPVSRKHHVVARMRPLCCRTTWVIVTKQHRCWAVATAAASLIVTGCTNIRGTRDSYKEVAESFR